MWFRNALVYRFSQDFELLPEDLAGYLKERPARPCANQETHTLGFQPPLGRFSENLVHVSGDAMLVALRKEEKILPSSVIKDALDEKIEAIESRDGRKVYKKERDTLKDEIVINLLPRAFVRNSVTMAVIDTKAGLVYVDTSSTKRAEDMLSMLREVIGTLPVRPVSVKISPANTMTEWVKEGAAPEGFMVADNAVLSDTSEDGGKIAATRQDLASDEIQNHLQSGKLVTQLVLGWQEKLSFTLDSSLAIKKIKFEDLLQDEAADQGAEDMLAQLDAVLTIMTGTFREFFPSLFEALGGEEIPQGI